MFSCWEGSQAVRREVTSAQQRTFSVLPYAFQLSHSIALSTPTPTLHLRGGGPSWFPNWGGGLLFFLGKLSIVTKTLSGVLPRLVGPLDGLSKRSSRKEGPITKRDCKNRENPTKDKRRTNRQIWMDESKSGSPPIFETPHVFEHCIVFPFLLVVNEFLRF